MLRHIVIYTVSVVFLFSALRGVLAQRVQFVPVAKADVIARVEDIPGSDTGRASRIRELFQNVGCTGKMLREQAVEAAGIPNVICQLRGEGSGTVIVAAHYDRSTVARPIDDWSGASLLPSLYQSLRARKRRHSYIFVAFADHERSVSGAEIFAGHLSSAEAAQVQAMVSLDPLGLSPTKVWSGHSDKDLVHDLLTMVYTLKLPASQIDLQSTGATDADPFAARKIPCIVIHSLTQQNLQDDANANVTTSFRPDNYYDTYRLLAGYLAYLDEILKPRF